MNWLGLHIGVEITGDALRERHASDVERALDLASLRVAQYVKGVWIGFAQRLDVRRTGEYIRGVQEATIEKGSVRPSGTSAAFEMSITNHAPHASMVEDGRAGFHLPRRINWGASDGKIKHGPSGPYLVIPFRHRAHVSASGRASSGITTGATREMMPEHIYQQARALAPSFNRGPGPGRGERGGHPVSNRYTWGGRMRQGGPPRSAIGGPGAGGPGTHGAARTHWAASKYEGLVRVAHNRSGGGGSSYMTFRVITPRSQGWYIPAMHGHGIARKTAHAVSQGNGARRVEEILSRAVLDAFQESHP